MYGDIYCTEIYVSHMLDVRVPNRFCGMRYLASFRRDIWGLSRKQGREAGITNTSGSGISCFYGVGM